MFNFFKKKPLAGNLSQLSWSLSGLHCTSCAVNIDLTLEDLAGVVSSNTNYAKSEVRVTFNPEQTGTAAIKSAIEGLGYTVN
ncbi:MAG: heavy metal-associated domain-containing protein [Patescibacteria group bacterium]|mgnify:FL=1